MWKPKDLAAIMLSFRMGLADWPRSLRYALIYRPLSPALLIVENGFHADKVEEDGIYDDYREAVMKT